MLYYILSIRLNTGRSPLWRGRLYGAKIIVALISTNSSLPAVAGQAQWSLADISPVRDGLFVEINHKHKKEHQRGGLYVIIDKINSLENYTIEYFMYSVYKNKFHFTFKQLDPFLRQFVKDNE